MKSESKQDANSDKPSLATVTILFYEAPAGLEMHNTVLTDLTISESGRVMIPDSFSSRKIDYCGIRWRVYYFERFGRASIFSKSNWLIAN
ncbi:DUF2375 family protein [Shewanella sp. HL-SH8]|uniref:DUF2375 family protein n=1 Tax=Shewanella sp. HL-SH8 TaxID=3436242 RepID=UPI003EBD6905